MTLEDLKGFWNMNAYMSAYQKQNVYSCNLSGTMFFEKTPFHPDVLLREYVNILHHTDKANLIYYKRVGRKDSL